MSRSIKTPLDRIRRGAVVLAAIVVLAIVGYRFLGGYSWLGAIWMVVITISSVGYGEQSQFAAPVQLLTIVVIVLGMSAAVYTIGGLIQLVLEGELESTLGHRRMTKGIDRLKGHVVICGFGRIGQVLASELRELRRPFVVIDMDTDRIDEAKMLDYLCLAGDATDELVLRDAGLERAATLATCLPNDAANVFITLTAKELNPAIHVVARADRASTQKKLRQAGADRVVLPATIGAHQMARMITRPATADLIDLVIEREFRSLELDEFRVDASSQLVGTTVAEAEARPRQLVVVAVKAGGELKLNPEDSYAFAEGDVVIVMGRSDSMDRFRE